MKTNQPLILFTTAFDQSPIVRIELGNRAGQFATFDRRDFDTPRDNGFPLSIFLNSAGPGRDYVRFSTRRFLGNLETPARLLKGAGPGEVVRYRDGDSTNLRQCNRYVAKGYAPGQSPVDDCAAA